MAKRNRDGDIKDNPSQSCHFLRFSQQQFSGPLKDLNELTSIQVTSGNIEEQTMVLARVGLFKGGSHLKQICLNHLRIFGFSFKDKKKCCMFEGKNGSVCKRKPLRKISFDESQYLNEVGRFLVPGKAVCPACHIELKKELQEKNH